MKTDQLSYEEEHCAPQEEAPSQTKERPPILDLPKCECRCCGCVCVSSRGEPTRFVYEPHDSDTISLHSNSRNDLDGLFYDRIAGQEGVENHFEDIGPVPWIEALQARLADLHCSDSPAMYGSMEGTFALASSPKTPGLDSPDSLYNEPNSGGFQSMAESSKMSICSVLQRSAMLGFIGGCFQEQRSLFTTEPLRLGHEQKHCHNMRIGLDLPAMDVFEAS